MSSEDWKWFLGVILFVVLSGLWLNSQPPPEAGTFNPDQECGTGPYTYPC